MAATEHTLLIAEPQDRAPRHPRVSRATIAILIGIVIGALAVCALVVAAIVLFRGPRGAPSAPAPFPAPSENAWTPSANCEAFSVAVGNSARHPAHDPGSLYTVCYDYSAGVRWVVSAIQSESGCAPRPNVQYTNRFEALLGAYAGGGLRAATGYDRGHMAPAGDQCATADKLATFDMINVAPQLRAFNEGPWDVFEEYIRAQYPNTTVATTIMSSWLSDGVARTGPRIVNGTVLVPAGFCKVVLVKRAMPGVFDVRFWGCVCHNETSKNITEILGRSKPDNYLGGYPDGN